MERHAIAPAAPFSGAGHELQPGGSTAFLAADAYVGAGTFARLAQALAPLPPGSSEHSVELAKDEAAGQALATSGDAVAGVEAPFCLMPRDALYGVGAGSSAAAGAPLPLAPRAATILETDWSGQRTFEVAPSGAAREVGGSLPWLGLGLSPPQARAAATALRGVPDAIHAAVALPPEELVGTRRRIVMWDFACGREALPIPVVVDGRQDVPPSAWRRLLLAALHYTPVYVGKACLEAPPAAAKDAAPQAAAEATAPLMDLSHWDTLRALSRLRAAVAPAAPPAPAPVAPSQRRLVLAGDWYTLYRMPPSAVASAGLWVPASEPPAPHGTAWEQAPDWRCACGAVLARQHAASAAWRCSGEDPVGTGLLVADSLAVPLCPACGSTPAWQCAPCGAAGVTTPCLPVTAATCPTCTAPASAPRAGCALPAVSWRRDGRWAPRQGKWRKGVQLQEASEWLQMPRHCSGEWGLQSRTVTASFTLPVADPVVLRRLPAAEGTYELHRDALTAVDGGDLAALRRGGARAAAVHAALQGVPDLATLPLQALPLTALQPRPLFVEEWLHPPEAAPADPVPPGAATCPSLAEALAMLSRYTPLLRWAGILGSGAPLPQYSPDGRLQWLSPAGAVVGIWSAAEAAGVNSSKGRVTGAVGDCYGAWVEGGQGAGGPVLDWRAGRKPPGWQRDRAIAALAPLTGTPRMVRGAGTREGLRFPLPGPRPRALHVPFCSDALPLLGTPVVECVPGCPCGAGTAPGALHANDVVQRGLRLPLEVYWSGFAAKGFGVRCRCSIPKGTFVCLYTGLVTRSPSPCAAYVVDQDFAEMYHGTEGEARPGYKAVMEEAWSMLQAVTGDPGMAATRSKAAAAAGVEGDPTDGSVGAAAVAEPTLPTAHSSGGLVLGAGQGSAGFLAWLHKQRGVFVDASAYCNVARFFNHSCAPNLSMVPVLPAPGADTRVPALALYANQNIPAYDELTWWYVDGYGVEAAGAAQHKDAEGRAVQRCLCDQERCADKPRLERYWRRTKNMTRMDMMHLTPGEWEAAVVAEREDPSCRPPAAVTARKRAQPGRAGNVARAPRAGGKKRPRPVPAPASGTSEAGPPPLRACLLPVSLDMEATDSEEV